MQNPDDAETCGIWLKPAEESLGLFQHYLGSALRQLKCFNKGQAGNAGLGMVGQVRAVEYITVCHSVIRHPYMLALNTYCFGTGWSVTPLSISKEGTHVPLPAEIETLWPGTIQHVAHGKLSI